MKLWKKTNEIDNLSKKLCKDFIKMSVFSINSSVISRVSSYSMIISLIFTKF